MYLRTFTLAAVLLALANAHRATVEPALGRAPAAPVLEQGGHAQPLPFLGSGGLVVQAPVPQPAAALALLRGQTAQRPHSRVAAAARRGPPGTSLPCRDRAASVRACRLGTPPPFPRSALV